jgi:cbb3-type cytochrome c oxidase subunit III
MNKEPENYTRYLALGFILTTLIVASLAFYTAREGTALAQAAEEFTRKREQRGQSLYAGQCAACHGAAGEGGSGPALANRQVLKNTLDSVFFSVIRSGIPNTQMPAWSVEYGGPLTDEDVRDVVAFIRSWEATAPEIDLPGFTPDPRRGALLFESTCAMCHGENGAGNGSAPQLNDLARLETLPDDWYRATIRNGRPARGMPTWGTVLSPAQIEDLVALIGAWRAGAQVQAEFSIPELLEAALFSLEEADSASATLQVERALIQAEGAGAEILRGAAAQLAGDDRAGALATLQMLREQWPIGDPTLGATVYTANCSACHGPQGEGGIGKSLRKSEFVQAQSNAGLFVLIQDGLPGTAMAGFKDRLSEIEIADVIAFLRLWQE